MKNHLAFPNISDLSLIKSNFITKHDHFSQIIQNAIKFCVFFTTFSIFQKLKIIFFSLFYCIK